MRKAIVVVIGIGIAALTLSGCAPASTGGVGGTTGGSSSAPAASGGSSASMPTGKIDMCTVFTPAALSAASGKSFSDTETLPTDSGDGVYGCAYELADESGDWIVDIQESTGGEVNNDAPDLGGPSAVKKIAGTGYPTVGSSAGVDLVVGKDIVEVYTPASASSAQGTTDQFVKVAKAAIAVLSK